MSATDEEVKSTLEQLAVKKFGELTEAERTLCTAAVSGTTAYCGPPDKGPSDKDNAPAQAYNWGSERCLHAGLVAWLCSDLEAKKFVHGKGLTVACAKVIDKLDLSALVVPFPLMFFQCCFLEEITLLYADLLLLSMDGCLLRPGARGGVAIRADSLRARAVNLRNGFHANGEVNLRGAEIGNNVECDGGHLVNPAGTALSLNAAHIGGGVSLRNGFTSEGEVNLVTAQIGLDLDCSEGRFRNSGTLGPGRLLRAAHKSGTKLISVVFTLSGK